MLNVIRLSLIPSEKSRWEGKRFVPKRLLLKLITIFWITIGLKLSTFGVEGRRGGGHETLRGGYYFSTLNKNYIFLGRSI